MRKIWLENVQHCLSLSAVETSRFLLQEALELFPSNEKLWDRLIEVDQKHKDREVLCSTLEQAMLKTEHSVKYVLLYTRHLQSEMEQAERALEVL